jgi:RNA polymerase sigma-70 factor (ECF subfamily)
MAAIPAELYEVNRRYLWGLCYRMTGNASDADDLVQETFVKALEHPPNRLDLPMRPWLVRVALNLSRDLLRRNRRNRTDVWLPSPVPTEELDTPASYEPAAAENESPMARYDMRESVSFAFLLALEALTPSQRAVLLLREVFDYSTRETAEALGGTESSVKVTLLRARRAMQNYDKERALASPAQAELASKALEQFLLYLSAGNIEGLERLLTADVVCISDGGGEVSAALKPILGRDKVLRLILKTAERQGDSAGVEFRSLNGMPAVLFKSSTPLPNHVTRFTMHCNLDASHRIRKLHFVLAPSKLTRL